jgi:hypothetical protein
MVTVRYYQFRCISLGLKIIWGYMMGEAIGDGYFL